MWIYIVPGIVGLVPWVLGDRIRLATKILVSIICVLILVFIFILSSQYSKGYQSGYIDGQVYLAEQMSEEYERGRVEGKREAEMLDESLLADEYNDSNSQDENSLKDDSLTGTGMIYVMQDCPPVADTPGYEEPNSMKMNGKTYRNGFTLQSPGKIENYYIKINTDNLFSQIEFDLGHIDGGLYPRDGVFDFYIDDKYIKTITKSPKDSVTHEVVNINYGGLLRIEYKTGTAGRFDAYGFANVVLIP